MKFYKPMLAKSYEEHEDAVRFPCYVQPKLDGVRCITDGVTFWSREGNVFPRQNFKHLRLPSPLPYLVDGELGMEDGDFENIVSIVKRAGHPDSHRIRFNAFDLIMDEPYVRRLNDLKILFTLKFRRNQSWARVLTTKANNPEKIRSFYKSCVAMGLEGVMVRNAFGKYVSKRTTDLLKWKPLQDAEFPIIGVKEAKGKDAGTPIFICAARPYNGEDQTFNVRPMGTMTQRREMWKNRKKLIGQWITVEYQNLTRYGKPRFPRAKVLRDYE